MSARNYWSIAELIVDARYNRRRELELKMRARSEVRPSEWLLRTANTYKLRAEASEYILSVKRSERT